MSATSTPRRLAERLSRLGTETAYAVSDEAKQLSAKGLKIYPYHIGDLNFATPDVFVTGTSFASWNSLIPALLPSSLRVSLIWPISLLRTLIRVSI